jgi:membrane fusion protein, multidrug efflux system
MPDDKAPAKAPDKPAPEKIATEKIKPPRRLRRTIIRGVLLIGVPVVALAVAAFMYATGGRYVGTDDAFTKADTVPISADVSARVVAIEVHDNQQVKTGDILFRLDDEAFKIALAKA